MYPEEGHSESDSYSPVQEPCVHLACQQQTQSTQRTIHEFGRCIKQEDELQLSRNCQDKLKHKH